MRDGSGEDRQEYMSTPLHRLLHLATQCERRGEYAPLLSALPEALKQSPQDPKINFIAGMAYLKRGEPALAERFLSRAVAIDPVFHDAYVALAAAMGQRHRHREAMQILHRGIRLFPASATLAKNLAVAAAKLGDHHATDKWAAAALKLDQNDAQLWGLRARAALALGHKDQALVWARNAHRLVPTGENARLLGELQRLNGRPDLAVGTLGGALAVEPDNPALALALAEAHRATGRGEEAVRCLRAALPLLPADKQPWQDIVLGELALGNFALALEALEQADRTSPSRALAMIRATALPAIPDDRAEIARARAHFLSEVTALTVQTTATNAVDLGCGTFFLAYLDEDSRAHRRAYAELLRTGIKGLDCVAPHCRRSHDTPRRPRIGFVSTHLFDHTIADLFSHFCQSLPPDRFETILFFPPGPADAVRAALRQRAEQAIDLPDKPLAARKTIAEARLDVLIFLDIGMAVDWDLLAHGRLAPRQAMLWGHPETTGIPTIDFFLTTAAMEPADGESHYWERLIRMEGPGCAYAPAAGVPFDVPPLARADLNLPPDSRLYVCPQSLFKLHPDFDHALAAILRQDPDAAILLLEAPHPTMAVHLRRRLERVAGTDTTRVHFLPFLPKPRFAPFLAACDVMLDPFHYSGGHTSLTALAVGLPVVTWPGRFMRGRHTLGFYKVMGYGEMIADGPEDYVSKAVAVAHGRREQTSAVIRAARAPLFDRTRAGAAFMGAIEQILETSPQAFGPGM